MARLTEESVAGQLRALTIGQSFSRTRRLPLSRPAKQTPAEALQSLRQLINQTVSRLRKDDPGNNFRVESAVAITDDKQALLATVAVTRLDAGDTNDDEETDI